jgi:hypothetical protein
VVTPEVLVEKPEVLALKVRGVHATLHILPLQLKPLLQEEPEQQDCPLAPQEGAFREA